MGFSVRTAETVKATPPYFYKAKSLTVIRCRVGQETSVGGGKGFSVNVYHQSLTPKRLGLF